ncbi:nuclear RNA export factor 2-like [Trichechus manatus latirostris]|uniref:Nuclear RNA export factor 2-like n=1 Tax=Trichechus manatus latirostris TaxID=127582 RepID=A0A2Y9QDX3_TRIMA|nr:nuclear RNA export factor 2-like [Trichechus manatus latirostris]
MRNAHEDLQVPYGRRYDKTWLLNSIQSNEVFSSPQSISTVEKHAQFFVQDASTAFALKAVNYKICDEENQKIPSFVPYAVQNKLKPEQVEQLKLTVNKQCDVSQQALDIQTFCFDPDLIDHDSHMILNQSNHMVASLKIIEESFPELLSLNLYSNKLYQLGGLSNIIESCNGSETLKSLALQFLLQISLGEYSKGSRNMKKFKDPVLRVQLLKHTKHDVVEFLSVLSKTQHDISSFVVDMCVQTKKMLCFSLNELFKEVEGMCQAHVRAFTRIFIITPASNSSLCIINEVNDEVIVRNARPKETQSVSSNPVACTFLELCAHPVPKQQEMVQAFSTQSGMNLEWCQKCLEDSEQNYTRAGQVFTMFKAEGRIPEEAFKQSP